MQFNNQEVKDLLLSWLVISFIFGFGNSFLVAAFTVGLGFILHELAHKVLAQYFGCRAEFRADKKMLFMALIISFFGVIFIAPGAVFIRGRINRKQNGIISLGGPLANLLLAVGFLFTPFLYGALINAWIGLFNMIPFRPFDGSKILAWNKWVYGFMVAFFVGILFF